MSGFEKCCRFVAAGMLALAGAALGCGLYYVAWLLWPEAGNQGPCAQAIPSILLAICGLVFCFISVVGMITLAIGLFVRTLGW